MMQICITLYICLTLKRRKHVHFETFLLLTYTYITHFAPAVSDHVRLTSRSLALLDKVHFIVDTEYKKHF